MLRNFYCRGILLVTLITLMHSFGAIAQGFRVGFAGGLNSTWLLNKNVLDANDELDLDWSFGTRIGSQVVLTFNENFGVSIEGYQSIHNQNFTGVFYDEASFEARTSLTYLEGATLLRFNSNSGAYFEIGPQIGVLQQNSHDLESFNIDSLGSEFDYTDKSFDLSYNDKLDVSIIVGSGVDIPISESFLFTLGARVGIGLSDVTKEYESPEALGDAAAIDGISPLSYWAHYESAGTEPSSQFSYEKTTRFAFGLNFGISYILR